MSSRNWASGVEKLEKSEESDAGKAGSRKSSLAGARILGVPGSHMQPAPQRRAGPRGSAAPPSRLPVPGLADAPMLRQALHRVRAAARTPPSAAARWAELPRAWLPSSPLATRAVVPAALLLPGRRCPELFLPRFTPGEAGGRLVLSLCGSGQGVGTAWTRGL